MIVGGYLVDWQQVTQRVLFANTILTSKARDAYLTGLTGSNRHVDISHWNPVKHGWVNKVCDWPHSSFHRYLEQGIYTENWEDSECHDIDSIE